MNRIRSLAFVAALLALAGAGAYAGRAALSSTPPKSSVRSAQETEELQVSDVQAREARLVDGPPPHESFSDDLPPIEAPPSVSFVPCDGVLMPEPPSLQRHLAFRNALEAGSRTAHALANALRELEERQLPDGTWSGGEGATTGDVRLTALAALPFLWTGSGRNDRVVDRAWRALWKAQRDDGSFEDASGSCETDALATLVLLDCLATSGRALGRGPSLRGLAHVRSSARAETEPTWSSLVLDVASKMTREKGAEDPPVPAEGSLAATPAIDGARVPEGVLAAIGALRRSRAAGEAWEDVFAHLALTQETSGDAEERRGFWSARDGRGETETTAIFALLLAAKFRWAPEPGGASAGR